MNKLDNWHALLGWSADVAIIAVAVVAVHYLGWWSYPLAVIVIGTRQRALLNLRHWSAHRIAAKNSTLNLVIGTVLSAYPILGRHYGFKRSHVATHHPRLGDADLDPDLRRFIADGVYDGGDRKQLTRRLLIRPLLCLPIWAERVRGWGQKYRNRKGSGEAVTLPAPVNRNLYWERRMRLDRMAFLCFWSIVAGTLVLTGNFEQFVLFWLVPYATAFPVIGWFIELSEHTPMMMTTKSELHMTRNKHSRGIEKFLTGIHADQYHLDHHLDPRTPYWNLPKAHIIRRQDPSYAEVDDTFGGLFTRGPNGQPAAISQVIDGLVELAPVLPAPSPGVAAG
ncbi:fatty acid desaturase family protein [Skermania sp. ID1734]|uniref:fatty acid desaturase family protein n=1 Tax=Skermania sp. ID1734 TaxID=2597516 RepID=UPI001C8F8BF5|nr:fatty acid desaturase family protein [Skermania sp. ID1734]